MAHATNMCKLFFVCGFAAQLQLFELNMNIEIGGFFVYFEVHCSYSVPYQMSVVKTENLGIESVCIKRVAPK